VRVVESFERTFRYNPDLVHEDLVSLVSRQITGQVTRLTTPAAARDLALASKDAARLQGFTFLPAPAGLGDDVWLGRRRTGPPPRVVESYLLAWQQGRLRFSLRTMSFQGFFDPATVGALGRALADRVRAERG
jgi:hypothetical protein